MPECEELRRALSAWIRAKGLTLPADAGTGSPKMEGSGPHLPARKNLQRAESSATSTIGSVSNDASAESIRRRSTQQTR